MTLSLDELRSPDFNLVSDQEYSGEEVAETMAETMEQYMSKTRADYGSGVARPKIENKDNFELKGQFLKELRTNTFSGLDHEDANKHIEKVLEIVDLFHIPNITIDQVMLRAFPMSLTGAVSQQSTRNRGKAIVTSSAPTYDPEPCYGYRRLGMSKEKELTNHGFNFFLSKSSRKSTTYQQQPSNFIKNTRRANQEILQESTEELVRDFQCYNCKQYGHVSRECQKLKRVKDAAYHKEKMLLCKQEEAGVQLNAEQADWKDDTDDESEEQELEAHYMVHGTECQEELVDKLKGEIEDFKTKNKSLESSNNHFKEANNELSKTNQLMFKDLKKFQAELDKYNDVNYASKVEIDCAKA
ncbi:uncharacterized mitochondrial protein-like protein [Tanacetum coccineum]